MRSIYPNYAFIVSYVPTAYILSKLIIFKIYEAAWKWALMDMSDPCCNVWALSHLPLLDCTDIGCTQGLLQAWSLPSANSHMCMWEWHRRACSACHSASWICRPYLDSAGFSGLDLTLPPARAVLWLKEKRVEIRTTQLFFQILSGFLSLERGKKKKRNAVHLFSLYLFLLSLYVCSSRWASWCLEHTLDFQLCDLQTLFCESGTLKLHIFFLHDGVQFFRIKVITTEIFMLCLDAGRASFMQRRGYFWITTSCPTHLHFAFSVRGAGCWEENWEAFPVSGGYWFLSWKRLSQFRFIFQICLKERERELGTKSVYLRSAL